MFVRTQSGAALCAALQGIGKRAAADDGAGQAAKRLLHYLAQSSNDSRRPATDGNHAHDNAQRIERAAPPLTSSQSDLSQAAEDRAH